MSPHVVIINDDSHGTGGAASIALTSARLLRGRAVRVTFLTGDRGDNDELAALGVNVVSLQGSHILEGPRSAAALRGLYDRRTRRRLDQWIAANDNRETVYHLHNWHKVLSPSIFAVLERVAARLFISAHDFFLSCPNGGYFHYPNETCCALTPMGTGCIFSACDRRNYLHKLWRVTRTATLRRLFPFAGSAATIIAVHEGMVPLLERGGVDRTGVRVLRNPVAPWRSTRVAAERNRKIFFIGRLEQDKGIDLLASAARRAGAPLAIIGSGPLAPQLATQYPEIELLGRKSSNEIAQLIAQCRLVVMPSRGRETFGLVILEALMSGVPVLVSQFALIADEIANLGLAIKCNPYDRNEMAALIARLFHDDTAIRQMSYRAFDEARGLAPTPDEWCDQLLQLYDAAVLRSPVSGVWTAERAPTHE